MEGQRSRPLQAGIAAAAIGAAVLVFSLLFFVLGKPPVPAGTAAASMVLAVLVPAAVLVRRYRRHVLQHRIDVRRILSEAAHEIITILDSDALFDALFRVLDRAFHPARIAVVAAGTGESFSTVRSSGTERQVTHLEVSCQDMAILVKTGTADPGCAAASAIPVLSPALCSELRRFGAALVAPLVHRGKCLGFVLIGERPGGYGTMAREALGSFARVAAVAVENARRYGEAITDGLTRLAHQRYFLIRVHEAVERARRYRYPVSVLLADVDGFRAINEAYGHVFGDRVLREIAAELRGGCRETDIVARYEGDCFAVLLPEISGSDAHRVAGRLSGRLAALKPEGIALSLSFGVGVLDAEEADAGADVLLSRAKEHLASARTRKQG